MMNDKIEQRIERGVGIDTYADPVHSRVRETLDRAPRVRDALRGKWLGHPLHAALTDIPVGAWTAGLVLDLMEVFGKNKKRKLRRPSQTADVVDAIGLIGAIGAAASGIAEWSATRDAARRVGFVHGLANAKIAMLYVGSLVARKKGKRGLGIALSTAGYVALLASTWLGREMTYRLGAGVRVRELEPSESEVERVIATSSIEADAYVP